MAGRPLGKRVVGAGVAGVAAVFAVMPFAHADPVAPQSSTTPSPDQSAGTGGNEAGVKTQPQGQVQPQFGAQKIRVGVQIKDGSWVPPGTDTGQTKITIVETGPGVEGGTFTSSCRTVEGSEDPGSTETYCEFGRVAVNRMPAVIANGGLRPDAPEQFQLYEAAAGDTVTLTQTTVNKGLVIDSVPQTVGPCVNPPLQVAAAPLGGQEFPTCPNFYEDFTDIVFTDPGLPPTAIDNHATVLSGHSVVINVLNNDITHGAPAQIDGATQPSHGKSIIAVGQAAAAQTNTDAKAPGDPTYSITYKSTAPYVGHDKFRYTMSTPNGKSTATVFITVIAPPPTAVNDSARTEMETPVTIDVLNNDDANGGGALSVSAVGTPGHGTATISNGEVVYTPESGFSGTDTFVYTAATKFGTDTATVTVTIPETGGLSATGSSSHNLANIGALLLLTGGAATVVGRRRYSAKHAGFH